MEKLNVPPFYVGQKVVCVSGGKYHKTGDVVNVVEISKTQCGCWYIGTSKRSMSYYPNGLKATCDCGCETNDNFTGFSPNDFRPLEEIKPPFLTFEKIKETEKEEVLILN